MIRSARKLVPLIALGWLAGCGPSVPEHQEKPLVSRPSGGSNRFDELKTPEEKIKYIENSGAPEVEKKRAIEQIKSGKL